MLVVRATSMAEIASSVVVVVVQGRVPAPKFVGHHCHLPIAGSKSGSEGQFGTGSNGGNKIKPNILNRKKTNILKKKKEEA